MAFEPDAIQSFGIRDVAEWFQVGDQGAYVGYVADEAEGSRLGLACIRFRAGVRFDFRWAYDEVAVVTKGSLSVRVGGGTTTAAPGQSLYMPAGVLGAFDIREDMEAFCVHHPTDGEAGRAWQGSEPLPAEAEIRPATAGEVWATRE